jgi:hypothetical protein
VSLCLTKYHAMKMYWGSGDTSQRILNLGCRWKWAVSFVPWPLYTQGKRPWYPLDRRLGVPQSQSDRSGEEEGNPGFSARNLVTIIVSVYKAWHLEVICITTDVFLCDCVTNYRNLYACTGLSTPETDNANASKSTTICPTDQGWTKWDSLMVHTEERLRSE